MAINPNMVLDSLRRVYYPGKGKDIVSLGIVEDDIRIDGKKVSFSLIFEKSNDPFIKSIMKSCVNAVKKGVGPDTEIEGNIKIKFIKDMSAEPEPILPGVKNIIAVASGKGGVGKSTVSVNLAIALAKKGYKVGILDADIFGPSLPKMMNMEEVRPVMEKIDGKDRIVPVEKYGINVLSIGFFVNPDDALVWRGAMATNALKQLINDAYWGELDYLVFDLPPGTSDIHLTLVQTVSVTGAVIVSTPQDVALADAIKGISMFTGKNINVPVLGLVENMAWFTPAELPENKYYIFGEGGVKKLAERMNVPLLGQIPLVQGIRESGDKGTPVALEENNPMAIAFSELAARVSEEVEIRNKTKAPTETVKIKTHKR